MIKDNLIERKEYRLSIVWVSKAKEKDCGQFLIKKLRERDMHYFLWKSWMVELNFLKKKLVIYIYSLISFYLLFIYFLLVCITATQSWPVIGHYCCFKIIKLNNVILSGIRSNILLVCEFL